MGFIKNAVLLTLAFVYGVFTVILYACLSIKNGTFFSPRTEKENLELQIGKFPPRSSLNISKPS